MAERLAELRAAQLAGKISTATEPDGWLDSRRAAEYLGTSPNALRKATAAGRIEHEQLVPNGKLWFRREALDRSRYGL